MQEVKRTAECGDNNEEPYSSFNSFWVTQSIDYLLMYKFGVHSVLANILDQLVMLQGLSSTNLSNHPPYLVALHVSAVELLLVLCSGTPIRIALGRWHVRLWILLLSLIDPSCIPLIVPIDRLAADLPLRSHPLHFKQVPRRCCQHYCCRRYR
jgi:hypothetical protein